MQEPLYRSGTSLRVPYFRDDRVRGRTGRGRVQAGRPMVNDMIWQGDPVRAPRCVLSTKITHTGNTSPDYHSHMAERETLVTLVETLDLKSYASGRLRFKRQGLALYDGVWEIYWLSDADAMALKIAWEG